MAEVLVVGCGAIGGSVAALLSEHADVFAVDGWAENVAAIRSRGLLFRHGETTKVVSLPIGPLSAEGARELAGRSFDVVLFANKGPHAEPAIRWARDTVADADVFVCLQNGLWEDVLAEAFGSERVVGEVTEFGARMPAAGEVIMNAAEGRIVVGDLEPQEPSRAEAVRELFGDALPVEISPNIRGQVWSKLIWNSMVNPVCALADLTLGEIWSDEHCRRVIVELCREGVAVASAHDVRLEPLAALHVDLDKLADPQTSGEALAGLTAFYEGQTGRAPSMLHDVRAGRPTEIDFLNGTILDRAESTGLTAPTNARIREGIHRASMGSVARGTEFLRTWVSP